MCYENVWFFKKIWQIIDGYDIKRNKKILNTWVFNWHGKTKIQFFTSESFTNKDEYKMPFNNNQ